MKYFLHHFGITYHLAPDINFSANQNGVPGNEKFFKETKSKFRILSSFAEVSFDVGRLQ